MQVITKKKQRQNAQVLICILISKLIAAEFQFPCINISIPTNLLKKTERRIYLQEKSFKTISFCHYIYRLYSYQDDLPKQKYRKLKKIKI